MAIDAVTAALAETGLTIEQLLIWRAGTKLGAGARTAGSEGCVSVQVCCLKNPKIPPGRDNREDLKSREMLSVVRKEPAADISVLGIFSWEGMDCQDSFMSQADLTIRCPWPKVVGCLCHVLGQQLPVGHPGRHLPVKLLVQEFFYSGTCNGDTRNVQRGSLNWDS